MTQVRINLGERTIESTRIVATVQYVNALAARNKSRPPVHSNPL